MIFKKDVLLCSVVFSQKIFYSLLQRKAGRKDRCERMKVLPWQYIAS